MRALKWMVILFLLFVNLAWAQKIEPDVYTEDTLAIIVTKKDPQFIIRLKSNRTTGYSWFLQKYDPTVILPLKHQYEAPNTKVMGAPGFDVWTFSVKRGAFSVPTVTQIHFMYARPWETKGENRQLVFKISTK